MKAIIFLIVMVGLVLLGGSQVTPEGGTWFFLIIPAFLMACWITICMLCSIWNHMEDLARLHSAVAEVVAAEERLAAVEELAADKHGLPEQLLALNQEDNPVTQYMKLVSQSISNLEDEKSRRARVIGRIASRKVGPFSIVVTIFGETAV